MKLTSMLLSQISIQSHVLFPQNNNNNNKKSALCRISHDGGVVVIKNGCGIRGGVSVYVAVVRLDTILSNSNAATIEKKDVQKKSIVA